MAATKRPSVGVTVGLGIIGAASQQLRQRAPDLTDSEARKIVLRGTQATATALGRAIRRGGGHSSYCSVRSLAAPGASLPPQRFSQLRRWSSLTTLPTGLVSGRALSNIDDSDPSFPCFAAADHNQRAPPRNLSTMTVSLTVDRTRWSAHLHHTLEQIRAVAIPVPVVKGNGYGFGRHALAKIAAEESTTICGNRP